MTTTRAGHYGVYDSVRSLANDPELAAAHPPRDELVGMWTWNPYLGN